MTEELLPCPFCGGEAEIIGGVKIDSEPCAECGNKSCNYVSSDYMTIKQWNTRAQPKYKRVDLDVMKEALRSYVVGGTVAKNRDAIAYNRAIDEIKAKYGDLYTIERTKNE